jgi:3D (Asp-Asp-Asp) domain-containing protein
MNTKIKTAIRTAFLKNIMNNSNNYLPLTNREMAMVKFFIKYNLAIALIISTWALPIYSAATFTKNYRISPIENHITSIQTVLATTTPEIIKKQPLTGTIREITMFTSRIEETDASPFITANGTDLRNINYNACASNAFSFGTKLQIEGLGDCVVVDRMNKRYSNSVDWYAGTDLDRAIKFGRQKLLVKIL